jgi:transcriptional regulator
VYLRPVFAEADLARITALVEANPFGLLVTHGPEGLAASHIPFAVAHEGDGLVLAGHLAAANPQCARLDGGTALAIFSGPHAYISPSWYRAQPAVPTWDYAAVHVHGTLELVTDGEAIRSSLRTLAKDDPGGFDLDALPEGFRSSMLAGIRVFRLRSERVEAQWKMSQNRSATDREGVIDALRAQGDETVAKLIEATLPKKG